MGAVKDYTMAIFYNNNYVDAFIARAASKVELNDFKDAIEDCSKAISLRPDYTGSYINRGLLKYSLKQDYCSDFKKACELGDCVVNNKFCK